MTCLGWKWLAMLRHGWLLLKMARNDNENEDENYNDKEFNGMAL